MNISSIGRFVFFICIAIVVLYSSCGKEKGNLYVPLSCDTTNVKYNDTIKNIVAITCAVSGCHVSGGAGPNDFTIYAELKAKVDDNGKVYDRVFVNASPMPPTYAVKQLTDCEKQKIKSWLNMGAPNN